MIFHLDVIFFLMFCMRSWKINDHSAGKAIVKVLEGLGGGVDSPHCMARLDIWHGFVFFLILRNGGTQSTPQEAFRNVSR